MIRCRLQAAAFSRYQVHFSFWALPFVLYPFPDPRPTPRYDPGKHISKTIVQVSRPLVSCLCLTLAPTPIPCVLSTIPCSTHRKQKLWQSNFVSRVVRAIPFIACRVMQTTFTAKFPHKQAHLPQPASRTSRLPYC